MKFVNIDTAVLREPEFSAATHQQVSIWLRLYAICAEAENRGLLLTAGFWTDQHCQLILRCDRKDLDNSPLWTINVAGLLTLQHYNIKAEEFIKNKRKLGKLGGEQRSIRKTLAARKNSQKGGRPCKIIPLQTAQTGP